MSRVALDGMWVPRVVSCALFVNDAISTKMNSYQCLCSLFAQQQQHRTHCAPSTAIGTRCHSLRRHSFTLSCRYPIIKSKIHWSFADALPSTQNERCVSISAREATLFFVSKLFMVLLMGQLCCWQKSSLKCCSRTKTTFFDKQLWLVFFPFYYFIIGHWKHIFGSAVISFHLIRTNNVIYSFHVRRGTAHWAIANAHRWRRRVTVVKMVGGGTIHLCKQFNV